MKFLLIVCFIGLAATGFMAAREWGKPGRASHYIPSMIDAVRGR